MATHDSDVFHLAYDYAWWLTGDDDQAAKAVLGTNGATELPQVLASVRSTAIDERTMCPASELALLHDRAELPLDEAAAIAAVEASDARTELAHGRLEALEQTVDDAFAHPERLGGLAVANPADIAHARTCDDCARALAALREGRAALEAIPIRVPDADRIEGAATPVAEQTVWGPTPDEWGPDPEELAKIRDKEPATVPWWAWVLAAAIAAAAAVGAVIT